MVDFDIKINHRKSLDAIIQATGIPKDKYKTVCSSIDKLDKEEWKVVKEELIQKKISEEQAEKLWSFAQMKDKPSVLLEKLKLNKELQENEEAKNGILIKYLKIMEIEQYWTFNISLVRGLDYYTGLIYGTGLNGTKQVGPISGGGRFDDLLGMF